MATANVIVDISHHNAIASMNDVKSAGILAIIHKSTEGTVFVDPEFDARRKAARQAGFLWGSYHFVSPVAPEKQVDFFLKHTDPKDDELIAIDYEPSSAGLPNMTLAQLVETVGLVKKKTGRTPVVYGGHLLREALGAKPNNDLAECPLWYARYADKPVGVPNTWQAPTMWQYTDGKSGNDPKTVSGISGLVDRSVFFGTADELRQRWPL